MISYLSDMDGVLIKEGEMIPGADKFIQALKDNDIDVIGKKMTIAGAGGAACD